MSTQLPVQPINLALFAIPKMERVCYQCKEPLIQPLGTFCSMECWKTHRENVISNRVIYPIMISCVTCGTQTKALSSKKKYCRQQCTPQFIEKHKEKDTIQRKCGGCPIEFSISSNNANQKFCSKMCCSRFYATRTKEQPAICRCCKREFFPKITGEGKYCSNECCRYDRESEYRALHNRISQGEVQKRKHPKFGYI